MKRMYTLRRFFIDGVHGRADLDQAIRAGNATHARCRDPRRLLGEGE